MRRVPAFLVALRALAAPALLAAAARGAPGAALAALVTLALLSDVFDGVIARRLGVATPALRHADSVADAVFYLAALGALWMRARGAVTALAAPLAALLALEAVRLVLERAKYGRMAAYHMWSAKLWGLTLWLGVCEAFLASAPAGARTDTAGPLLRLAVYVGLATDLEGLAATLVLPRWECDVPTLWHARQRARALAAARAEDRRTA